MTNQEKKTWLNRYLESEAEAARLEGEIQRLHSKAEKMTTTIKRLPSGGAGARGIETAVAAIDDVAAQLGEKRVKAMGIRREIEDATGAVPDGRLRMLLRYRYIDGMTWEKIAVEMDISYQWVCQLHGKALEKIAVLDRS